MTCSSARDHSWLDVTSFDPESRRFSTYEQCLHCLATRLADTSLATGMVAPPLMSPVALPGLPCASEGPA